MKGILIIDHGSVKTRRNHMLECVGELVQRMAGERVVVRIAHMELAAPTIAEGFACVRRRRRDGDRRIPVHALAGQTLHARHPAHGRGDRGAAHPEFQCR